MDPIETFAPGLFRGRTALVTGGGRGIGREIALAFSRLGAELVVAGRNPETLERTAADARTECLAVPTNIREIPEVEALVAAALARFGKIDFLVNNAGGQFPATPTNISDKGWRAVVDLNLHGTWNLCSRVGPEMARRGFGSIVNIVHIYSFERGAPAFAHSGAARAGVVNLTRSLAIHWAPKGVRVNALAPGTVLTRGLEENELAPMPEPLQLVQEAVTRDVPMGRLGDPIEIAAVTLFLCSPAASYVNGAAIVADGGLSLGNWTRFGPPDIA
jgi:NAD(P)-dependent dehydrogenase (short-subunit alcohol dehydrogenase family)